MINANLKQLRDAFLSENRDIRFVGGCVRDQMSNKIPKDIDLCTNATPDEQIEIYKNYGFRWAETGVSHGTITVVIDHVPYEITSLRIDKETDGRHAIVEFTDDWIADLERRDFTFNAMSLTFDGELVDPFNGLSDLQNGIVRFVGNPVDRIKEDYLRILRWFRFRGRFENFDADCDTRKSTLDVVLNHTDGLAGISKERIWSELKQIIVGPNGTVLMDEIGHQQVLSTVNLKFNIRKDNKSRQTSVEVDEASKLTKNPVTLLTIRYKDDAINIVESMNPSAKELQLAQIIRKNVDSPFSLRNLIAVHGVDKETVHEIGVARGVNNLELEMIRSWDVPTFPVSGSDLIAIGLKPGPSFSRIISDLKLKWANSNYTLTCTELLSTI